MRSLGNIQNVGGKRPKGNYPLDNGCFYHVLNDDGAFAWDTRYSIFSIKVPNVEAGKTVETRLPNISESVFWSFRCFSKGTNLRVSLAQEPGEVDNLFPSKVIFDVNVNKKSFLYIEEMPFVFEQKVLNGADGPELYLRVTNNSDANLELVELQMCFR